MRFCVTPKDRIQKKKRNNTCKVDDNFQKLNLSVISDVLKKFWKRHKKTVFISQVRPIARGVSGCLLDTLC